jgi:uncharacterized protein
MSAWGSALVGAVMLVGLVGTVVPVMPGLALMWLAALVYGLLAGFDPVGIVAMAVITVLLAGGTALSYLVPHRAGVRGGIPRSSLRLGIAGAVVGFFVIPVLGLPVGGVLGVMAGEYQRLGDWSAAWRTTKTVVVGFLKAAVFELLAGLAIFGVWIGWVLSNR